MAISHPDKATTSRRRTRTDLPEEITLRMTRETALALEALCKEMDAPVEEVMTQAFGLLMVAVEGQKQEQRLCLVDDDSNVVMEIVNFGIENDRDRDDSSLDDAADRFDS